MTPRLPSLLFVALLLSSVPSLIAQGGLLTFGDEDQLGDLNLSVAPSTEEEKILDQSASVIRDSQTISGAATTERGDGLLDSGSETNYSELIKDFEGSAFDSESTDDNEQIAATKDLIVFTIISFVTDSIVSFIALAVILNFLGAHTKYSNLAILAVIAAACAASLGVYMKALPPNPIGMAASAFLLMLLLGFLRDIRKYSAAIGGGLFSKIISGLSIWVVSLGADALF